MRANLFSNMKFIILQNQMNPTTLNDLKEDIRTNGGKFEIVECPRSSNKKIKADFLLC